MLSITEVEAVSIEVGIELEVIPPQEVKDRILTKVRIEIIDFFIQILPSI